MRILVTGGCGFIASNFIRFLYKAMPDVFVVNVDLLTYAGNPASVRDVVMMARAAFGAGQIEWKSGNSNLREANWLSLETAKARKTLRIEPRWQLAEAVERTMAWYRQHKGGCDARIACEADIDAYEKLKQAR